MSFMRIPPSNESTGAAAGYVRNQINQIGGGEQPLFTEKLSANLPMCAISGRTRVFWTAADSNESGDAEEAKSRSGVAGTLGPPRTPITIVWPAQRRDPRDSRLFFFAHRCVATGIIR
jgi:hypothetical protein